MVIGHGNVYSLCGCWRLLAVAGHREVYTKNPSANMFQIVQLLHSLAALKNRVSYGAQCYLTYYHYSLKNFLKKSDDVAAIIV